MILTESGSCAFAVGTNNQDFAHSVLGLHMPFEKVDSDKQQNTRNRAEG